MIFLISITVIIFLLFAFYIKAHPLQFYNVPEYYFSGSDGWRENEEPAGYENRQFITCLIKRFCAYDDYVKEDYLVVYRNNNKYSDKQFGRVTEIRERIFVLEVINQNGVKITKEIPKKWVFGKD